MKESLQVPPSTIQYGFHNDPAGTHTSRTMMLKELRALLSAAPHPASYEQLRAVVVEENALLKRTTATRRQSFRMLRELYALEEQVLLFRALRDLWDDDPAGQPLLALLCACARDPLLRATAGALLPLSPDAAVAPAALAAAVANAFPGRYYSATLAKIGRNAASSWQQSGHLVGHLTKSRGRAQATPAAAAYALLLGHLCGAQGEALFATRWAALLDAPPAACRDLARRAAQQGWLEYRHAGGVTEMTFHHLLRPPPAEAP